MIVLKASSSLSAEEIEGLLIDEEAVAIRPDCVQSDEELMLALHLASDAFEKKRNIAKKLKYEFLLWLSGKTDIRRALKATGAESGKDFLLVFLKGGMDLNKLKIREKPLNMKKKAEPLALERISLGRI
ncbi:MAG: KEOPS complex subunit Cgi121 [Candidatus Micrarchaeota archaeon]